jgi:hypothetical protein
MSDYISVSNNFFICPRILPRFSVDFGFILHCTFSEVDLVVFFSCNVSGNAISGSLSFSNFIRSKLVLNVTDSRNVNNVVCVSA